MQAEAASQNQIGPPLHHHMHNMFYQFIQKVGTFGKYQKLTLLLLLLASFLCGELTFVTPFLYFEDTYSCTTTLPNNTTCRSYVCSLPPSQRAQYISAPSIATLANKFGDYRCIDTSSIVSVSILITYLGIVASYLVLSLLGGYFGRKTFVVVGLLLSAGGVIMSMFVGNIYVASVGIMLGLFGVQWVFSISFTIISQIVDQKYREKSLVAVQIFLSVGHLADTGIFFWLRDWQKVFIYFFIIPTGLVLIAYILITVDTPVALLRECTPQQVMSRLLWMAKMNGVQQPRIALQQIMQAKRALEMRQKQQDEGASRLTVVDLFRYGSLRYTTIFFIIIQIAVAFLYFAPNLMLSQFHLDIFINGLVLGLSYLLSDIFCYYTVKYFKRKITAIVTLLLIFLCSFALIFLFHPKSQYETVQSKGNVVVLVLLFVITFAISIEYTFFYVYLTELYPSQIRVIGISLITLTSGITLAVTQLIIDKSIESGFSVMIIFCIFAVASVIASFFLPETFHLKPADMIKQLSGGVQRKQVRQMTLQPVFIKYEVDAEDNGQNQN